VVGRRAVRAGTGRGWLTEAVDTYAGDLLEGRAEEWLVDERERLAKLHPEALERLARQHERNQHWPEAIRPSHPVAEPAPV